MPARSIGMMNAVRPLCLTTSGSDRAISSPHSEKRAPELHTFCPLTTHSSPSRRARHARPPRSDPAPGSENSWQHSSRAARKRATSCSRCESSPNIMIVGAISRVVTLWVSWDAGSS